MLIVGHGSRLGRTIRKTFISLRNRNFKLFFIGQTISNTGNWLTNVALVLLVLKITGSGLMVGVSSILYSTSTTTIVQVESKPEMHGRVLALQSVLQMGTAP